MALVNQRRTARTTGPTTAKERLWSLFAADAAREQQRPHPSAATSRSARKRWMTQLR